MRRHDPQERHRSVGRSADDRGRDDLLAMKRARVALIGRLEERGAAPRPGEVSAVRLLAEVDLALSEAES